MATSKSATTGPENPQVTNLMQDTKTGKLVEFIGVHDKEYAMVRDGAGNVNYVTLDQLVPYPRRKVAFPKSLHLSWRLKTTSPCRLLWCLQKTPVST